MGIKHKPEPKVRHNGSIGGIVPAFIPATLAFTSCSA